MVIPRAKILLVDDEPNVLLTVSAILRQDGYDVDAVSDGEAAIRQVRARHYDLVLTDLKMPGVDGLGVLSEVGKRSPNTVTVMMTGYASVDSALEAVQLGALEYLLKPVEVAELRAAVRRSLERKRLSEVDTLYRISRTATTLDSTAIAAEVCKATREVLGVADAVVLDIPPGEQRAQPYLSQQAETSYAFDEGTWQQLQAGEVVTGNQEGPQGSWARGSGIASYALAPGIAGGRLACVLCAHNGPDPYDFHASASRFLQALAGQAALALAHAALFSALQSTNRDLASANEKLRELDKLKSKFLSIATHELRTPLTVILGYNTMLAESLQGRLSPEERGTLEESIAACRRLIRLVNSMLDVSQIESGKMRMEFAPADIGEIVSRVVRFFQQEARKRQIRLLAEVPSRLPKLSIDSERIEQVLTNLLHNALKFTGPEGCVVVSVRWHGDAEKVEISVADSGIGISTEDLNKVFDEFVQVGAPGRRSGSGLGLAIAKRIVEGHQGEIRVTSVPSRGSTFTFTLPVRTRQDAAA